MLGRLTWKILVSEQKMFFILYFLFWYEGGGQGDMQGGRQGDKETERLPVEWQGLAGWRQVDMDTGLCLLSGAAPAPCRPTEVREIYYYFHSFHLTLNALVVRLNIVDQNLSFLLI